MAMLDVILISKVDKWFPIHLHPAKVISRIRSVSQILHLPSLILPSLTPNASVS